MKTRYIYALWALALTGSVLATLAWTEHRAKPMTDVPDTPLGSLLTLYTRPRQVPALHFRNAAGQALTLDDFHGRVVLVNLWATWCVPCRKEMPTLDHLQARLGGADFQVVVISQDKAGLAAVNTFYQTTGIVHLKRYIDASGQNLDAVHAIGLPTSLLIDRQGRAIGTAIGARSWDSPAMVTQIRRVAGLPTTSQP